MANLPRTIFQLSKSLCSTPTDIILTEFHDRYLLVISQFQKLGTIIQIKEESISSITSDKHVDIKVSLGNDVPEIHAVAKLINDKLKLKKPILLGLSMKSMDMSVIKELSECLTDLKASFLQSS